MYMSCARDRSLLLHELRLLLLLSLASRAPQPPRTWQERRLHTSHRRHLLQSLSWTGCYVGANVGGGWASNSSNDVAGAVTGVAGADLGSHTAGGFIGGGQIGCDYQAGVCVFGLQGMFDGSGME